MPTARQPNSSPDVTNIPTGTNFPQLRTTDLVKQTSLEGKSRVMLEWLFWQHIAYVPLNHQENSLSHFIFPLSTIQEILNPSHHTHTSYHCLSSTTPFLCHVFSVFHTYSCQTSFAAAASHPKNPPCNINYISHLYLHVCVCSSLVHEIKSIYKCGLKKQVKGWIK